MNEMFVRTFIIEILKRWGGASGRRLARRRSRSGTCGSFTIAGFLRTA